MKLYLSKKYDAYGNLAGYNGESLWLKSFREWNIVMQDMNRVFRARNEPQIGYCKDWLV
jgi:hypothetical protein